MRATFCAVSAWLWAAAAAAEPPAELYGRLPEVADVAISPDGSKIAIAANRPEGSSVLIRELDSKQMLTGGKARKEQSLRGVGWADEGTATFTLSQTLSSARSAPQGWRFKGAARNLEYFRVGTLRLDNERMALLMDKEETSWASTGLGWVMTPIEGDPGYGRMLGYTSPGEGARLAVHRVSLKTGEATIAETIGEDTVDVVMAANGKVAASADSDEKTNRWRIFAHANGKRRPIMEGDSATGAPPAMVGLFSDGRLALIRSAEDADTDQLTAVDLATGAEELKFAPEGFDVGGAITDPYTHVVIGARHEDAYVPVQTFFDPELAEVSAAVSAVFDGGYARLENWSRDRSRFIVYGQKPNDAGGYYLFEPKQRRIMLLARPYAELPPEAIAEVRGVTYKARDGVRISGYLTLPNGKEPKNLPLVALVHGGPHARDTWGFDYWAQFLASRGYAVLQPNFRGSEGFGAAFMHAGFGEWGGKMQTDVEDGVANLIKAGYVDPNRVCIMGASYGGYAALAGATLTPDRYGCAVSVNGVSDLELMLKRTLQNAGKESSAMDWWTGSIGDLRQDREKVRGVSPAKLAYAVKAPVLIVYGTDDSIVPNEQSLIMIDKLRDAGKDVTAVVLKKDDHWLSSSEARTQLLSEIDAFLKAKMPPS